MGMCKKICMCKKIWLELLLHVNLVVMCFPGVQWFEEVVLCCVDNHKS